MSMTDVLMIVAVLLSPFVAVFAQRAVEDRKENRTRRLWIFKNLMATRGTGLSASHVQALNLIELEFNRRKDEAVRRAWRAYHDHLNAHPSVANRTDTASIQSWVDRVADLLNDLLGTMGRALGYDFDSVLIRKGFYAPQAHADIERDQQSIRGLLIEVLEGRRSVRIAPDSDDESAKARKSLASILEGKKPLRVRLDDDAATSSGMASPH